MIQAASITEADRVLVVGCATGYSAAIIARLAGAVVVTEPDPALADTAKANLSRLGITNVTIGNAEAAVGDAAHGPYDVIVLDGATEVEPYTLYEQLKPAGRLVGVFAGSQPPRATLVTRSAGDFGNRVLFDASAPILPGLQRLPAFSF
jgi:protein-L-isoaspartate(D-aspartate) O-methyltransferase